MTQTELAQLLDVGKVTVGGLVDRLEASGHIERRADPEDRRAKRIFVTPKGYKVIDTMTAVGNDTNAIILAGISSERIRIAEDVLHDIKENLRRHFKNEAIEVGEDD